MQPCHTVDLFIKELYKDLSIVSHASCGYMQSKLVSRSYCHLDQIIFVSLDLVFISLGLVDKGIGWACHETQGSNPKNVSGGVRKGIQP